MKQVKTAVFIAVALSLMLFASCGGDSSNKSAASLSVQTNSVKAYVGSSETISVTAQNTDFTVSANPAGSGCVKNAKNVVCTPTAAGVYTVTLTATADTSKKASATVTVPEMEIFVGKEQTLYADETESAVIEFNAAGEWTATATDSSGGAPDWLSLSVANSGIASVDSTLRLYGVDRETESSVSGSAGCR